MKYYTSQQQVKIFFVGRKTQSMEFFLFIMNYGYMEKTKLTYIGIKKIIVFFFKQNSRFKKNKVQINICAYHDQKMFNTIFPMKLLYKTNKNSRN